MTGLGEARPTHKPPDQAIADSLVEALALSSDHEDPFHQAAEVLERLWDRGVVLVSARGKIVRAAKLAAVGFVTGFVAARFMDDPDGGPARYVVIFAWLAFLSALGFFEKHPRGAPNR